MKKILVAFVAVLSTAAFASESATPPSMSETAVVQKAKKNKKKGKKHHGHKKAKKDHAMDAAPAEPAAPPADAPAPAGQ